MKIIKWLDEYIEEFFLVIFLVLISVVMFVQVLARYVLNDSLSWAEEFCRYCYIWSVFLSISFTLKRGNMLRVGVLMDLFPTVIQNIVKITCNLVMLGLFLWFFRNSLTVVNNIKNVTREISSAMQLPMWIMYMSTVIGFGLSSIRALQAIIHDCRHFGDRTVSTLEATINEAKSEVELLEGGKN